MILLRKEPVFSFRFFCQTGHIIENCMDIRYMCKCALMCAVISVLAPLSIPLSTLVPISLATFAVMLTGAVFGPKAGLISVFLYLLIGFAGIPVFSGYASGPAALFGVTGGFLFGYLPLVFLTGYFAEKTDCSVIGMIEGMVSGTFVLYAIGTLWFMIFLDVSLGKALAACVLPFLPGDAAKIALVCLMAPRIRRQLKERS